MKTITKRIVSLFTKLVNNLFINMCNKIYVCAISTTGVSVERFLFQVNYLLNSHVVLNY